MPSWAVEPPELQDRKPMSSSNRSCVMAADMGSWAFERPLGLQDRKPTSSSVMAAEMGSWAFKRPRLQDRVLHGRPHSRDEGPTTSGSTMAAFDPGTQAASPRLEPNISPTSCGSTDSSIQLEGTLDDYRPASGFSSRKNRHQIQGTAPTVTGVTFKGSGTLDDHSPASGCSSRKNRHQIQGFAPTGSGFTAKGSGQVYRGSKKQSLNATTCDFIKTFDQIQDTVAQVQPMSTGSGYTRTTYQLERNLVQHFPMDTNGSGQVGEAVVQHGPSALATNTSGQVEEFRWNSPWIFSFNLTRIAKVFSHLRRRLGLLTVTVSLANFCLKVLSVTPVSM